MYHCESLAGIVDPCRWSGSRNTELQDFRFTFCHIWPSSFGPGSSQCFLHLIFYLDSRSIGWVPTKKKARICQDMSGPKRKPWLRSIVFPSASWRWHPRAVVLELRRYRFDLRFRPAQICWRICQRNFWGLWLFLWHWEALERTERELGFDSKMWGPLRPRNSKVGVHITPISLWLWYLYLQLLGFINQLITGGPHIAWISVLFLGGTVLTQKLSSRMFWCQFRMVVGILYEASYPSGWVMSGVETKRSILWKVEASSNDGADATLRLLSEPWLGNFRLPADLLSRWFVHIFSICFQWKIHYDWGIHWVFVYIHTIKRYLYTSTY